MCEKTKQTNKKKYRAQDSLRNTAGFCQKIVSTKVNKVADDGKFKCQERSQGPVHPPADPSAVLLVKGCNELNESVYITLLIPTQFVPVRSSELNTPELWLET